jgi:hypothetical protein
MDPATMLAMVLIGGGWFFGRGKEKAIMGKGTKGGVPVPVDLPEVQGIGATEAQAREAIRAVRAQYGQEIAEWVERLWRKESNHFRSGEFKATGGAGMHPWAASYPWGWDSLRPLWDAQPALRPIGYTLKVEGGTGKARPYLVFRSPYHFALNIAYLIAKRFKAYGDWHKAVGQWYSTDPVQMAKYGREAGQITPRFAREA